MVYGDNEGVAWLRAARSRMLSGERYASAKEALAPLLGALDLLDVVPAHLAASRIGSSWTLASGCTRSEAARAYVLSSGWLLQMQRFLLERVVVDWTDDLAKVVKTVDGTESTLHDEVLRAAFSPALCQPQGVNGSAGKGKAPLIAVIEDGPTSSGMSIEEDGIATVGHILASGLSACSQVMTAASRAQAAMGPSTVAPHVQLTEKAVLVALGQLVKRSSQEPSLIPALLTAALKIGNLARREKFWLYAVKELCAVPVRVSNMLGTRATPPLELQDGPYFAIMGGQLEAAVHGATAAHTPTKESQVQLDLLSKMLEKIAKSGVMARAVEMSTGFDQDMPDFISSVLNSAICRLAPTDASPTMEWSQDYLNGWRRIMRALEPSDLAARVVQIIVAYLDMRIFRRRKLSELVADAEKGRIGAEGRAFLSAEAARSSLLVGKLLQLFLPAPHGDQQLTSDANLSERFVEMSADEEEEEEAQAEDNQCWASVVFGNSSLAGPNLTTYSPAMARCLAVHLRLVHGEGRETEASLSYAIDEVTRRWANAERVRRTSLAEAQYLTTLLLSCLALCSKQSHIPTRILQSATFIQGVSTHMSHQDPAVRRLGMIVAEVLDAAVKASAHSGTVSSKRLDFGATIWNGRGEGKEAARVLRAMFLGWAASTPLLQAMPTELDSLRGILGCQEPVRNEEAVRATDEDQLEAIGSHINEPRSAPLSRTLPVRKDPPRPSAPDPTLSLLEPTSSLSLLSGGKARNTRPLISEISSEAPRPYGKNVDRPPLRAYALPDEDDGDQSSSSEDDSDDDGPEELMPSKSQPDEGSELLNVTVPKKRERKRPVYIGDLIPLLRSTDRSESRKGLKNSEELIRRKTGWGMEIEECAVELALALAALHNNWSTKHFEERRTGALSALIVAAPRAAGGCIIEQYFSGHYSIAQRMAMLNSLVEAARELSERGGQSTALQARRTAGQNADALIKIAAGAARKYGEAKYAEVRQVNRLNVLKAPRRAGGPLIQETGGPVERKDGRPVNVPSLAGAPIEPLPRYTDIASSVFIFPLVNRFWALLNDAGARHSRSFIAARSGMGRARARGSVWQGAGVGSVLSAPAVGALLDALAVLASMARNALDFQRVVVPELLELSLAVPRAMLPLLGGSVRAGGGIDTTDGVSVDGDDEETDGMVRVHAGAITLAVLLIDAAREADNGRFLRREQARLLADLDLYATEVFQAEQERDRGPGTSMGRAGRASATLVLRLQEIRSEA